MRVDRQSRIHRILGLVPLSWNAVAVLRWLGSGQRTGARPAQLPEGV